MEKSNQIKLIILAVVIVVLVAIVAVGSIVLGSSKSIFKTNILGVLTKLENINSNDEFAESLYTSPMELTGNLKVTSKLNADLENSAELQKLLNGSNFKYTMKSDIPADYTEVNLDYSFENSSNVKFSGYADADKMYVFMNGIYDKYILMDDSSISNFNDLNNITSSDYKYLSEKFGKALIDNLDNKYLSKSKSTVELDKTIKTTKTTLDIGKMVDDEVFVKIFDQVLADEKCVTIMVKIINDDEYTTKESIQQFVKENFTKQADAEATTFSVSIHTTGIFNKLVMIEAGDNIETLRYIDYSTKSFDQKIDLIAENKEMFSVLIKELGNDKYDITVNSEGIKVAYFTGTITNELLDLTYEINVASEVDSATTQKFTGTLKVTYDIDEKANTAKSDFVILIKSDSFGEVTLTNSTEFKKVDAVVKPDFTNSIAAEAMSTKDMFDILAKLSNLEVVQKFNALTTSTTIEEDQLNYDYSPEMYDLDYNYDYENLEY